MIASRIEWIVSYFKKNKISIQFGPQKKHIPGYHIITSFNEEHVRFSPFNVDFGDKEIVNVPGKTPRRLACNKAYSVIASFPFRKNYLSLLYL